MQVAIDQFRVNIARVRNLGVIYNLKRSNYCSNRPFRYIEI